MENDNNSSDSRESFLAYQFLFLGTMFFMWKKSRRERRFWVRPYLTKRALNGAFISCFEELMSSDAEKVFTYTRMTKDQFQYVLDLVKPHLMRSDTRFRKAISPEERLAVTLRFLATGESQSSLSLQYKLGCSTISETIYGACNVLWNVLSPIYLPPPTKATFAETAQRFWDQCYFPNCIGAVDGKHIRIMCPKKSGSEFFNYKKYFSVVLLGLCDADYRFAVIDIGAPGRVGDSTLFPETAFGRAYLNGEVPLLEPRALPNTNIIVPHFIVADAFPLKKTIMNPIGGNELNYDKRVFNYRSSRARRVIENTFGILVARWRILKTEINVLPETINVIVKATCCLHSYLRTENMRGMSSYCPQGYIDREDPMTHTIIPGEWRRAFTVEEEVERRPGTASNAHTRQAGLIREALSKFFVSEKGSVPWQHCVVTSTGYRLVATQR